MVEKKATTKTAAKKPAAKKAPVAKKDVLYLNAENAGFRAVMYIRHWQLQKRLSQ